MQQAEEVSTLKPDLKKDLPEGWIEAPLGEFIDHIDAGKSFKCEERTPQADEVGVTKVSSVSWGEYQEDESKTCRNESYVDARLFIRDGDFLFSRANTVDLVGACVIATGVTKNVMLSDKILRINFHDIVPPYVLYFLRSRQGRKQIEALCTGNQESMRNIGQDRIRRISIALPPLNEQRRIVAKIEALFSELDKGVESLTTARAQLKTYRQALLKHAFEGKLTEQWRKDHADELESADQLLARIREERAARYQQQLEEWQAQVAQWEADGKPGKKPRKPAAPKDQPLLDETELKDLPVLPDGWGWARYGDLCSIVRNGVSRAPSGDEGEKIFRISAVRPMAFDMEDYRRIPNEDGAFDEYLLSPGDLVFTRYNGSRRYVGVAAVFRSTKRYLFPDKLIQTRLAGGGLSEDYVEAAVNFGPTRRFLEDRIRTTAGQSGVSGSDIKLLPVPVCSPTEQREIGSILSAQLSQIDKMEETIDVALRQSEALRQSILKRAFEGRLLPQDPNDEPAAALLTRIRAQREAQPQRKGGRRRARVEA